MNVMVDLCLSFIALNLGEGVMIMDGFKVFTLNAVPGNPLIVFHRQSQIAYDVFHKFRIIKGLLGNKFFVRALEHRINRSAGGGFHNLHKVLNPKITCKPDAGADFAALIVGAIRGNLLAAWA